MICLKINKKTVEIVLSVCIFALVLGFCVSGKFKVAKNLTDSLPHFGYLLHMGGLPKNKDYIGFYSDALKDAKDLIVVKQVVALPGDRVSHQGRKIFINGLEHCYAKPKSSQGEPLEIGFSGVIPKNKFFVTTPHKDSFDSRYAKIGLIDAKDIVAVAYPIF